MKRFIITLAVLVLGASAASAQLLGGSNKLAIRVDAAVGFNKGDYKVENFSDLTSKTVVGYRFGASVNIPLSSMFYVSPGIVFQSKGSETSLDNLIVDTINPFANKGSIKVKSHYIEIPVHVGLRIPVTSLFAVNIQTGPYFSYALSGEATSTDEKGSKTTFDIYKSGVNEIMQGKRFDMGWGAAAMVDITHYYVLVGADFGFFDTLKDIKNFDATLKNTSFHVGLGIRF
ncbi:porin family protein [Porphyromonas pogonae]|uniref:porin family protein n=1 Tax=Porphyromonas pogonae TaxID=867595 RepID=UPI002E7A99E0|nr:porin family protein [Porphyromonas pogonae]